MKSIRTLCCNDCTACKELDRSFRSRLDKLLGGTNLQKELARRVTKAINVEAYDLFLQGWAHYNRETADGYGDAIPLLTDALERDPTFLRPHAVLAAIYYEGSLRRWNQTWGISNFEAVRKAYEHLQSTMAEPTALGLSVSSLMHIQNGRYEAGLADARKAVSQDPNDPTAHITLANALSMSGDGKKALEHAEQAVRLNPHYPASYVWTMGLAHFVDGDYKNARTRFEEAGTEHTGLSLVPVLATYGLLSRPSDAKKVLEVQKARWQKWYPGHPMTVRSLIANFPPFLRAEDVNHLSEGLKKAMVNR